MNLRNNLIVFTFLSIFILQGNTQSSLIAIEDVILLNNKPYLVRMSTTGDILSFEKDLKDTNAAIASVKRRTLDLNDIIIPSMTEEEEIESALADVTLPEDEVVSKGASEAVVNYNFDLAFDHRSATLSKLSVRQIYQVADLLNQNPELKCTIESFYYSPVAVSTVLSKNRVNGILELLSMKGVDLDRVSVIEKNNKDWANNRVQVELN